MAASLQSREAVRAEQLGQLAQSLLTGTRAYSDTVTGVADKIASSSKVTRKTISVQLN
jgi:hypothetical protein